MASSLRRLVLIGLLTLTAAVSPARAQAPAVVVSAEGAALWLARNDVRIPPETGTPFSIVDLIGNDATPAWRAEVAVNFNDKHGVRLTYAPLEVTGTGVPAVPISFAGGAFAAGTPTDATYNFSSYRATYRYRFFAGDRWTWRVGVTGFVRDARVALAQPGVTAEDTDVGLVPLLHVDTEVRLADRWRLVIDGDASAAPQGRAIDAIARVEWSPSRRLGLSAGYRVIEGGADVDTVYNFAWLNFAVAGVHVRF
ncbi:MAG: hypothetical protein IT178_16270 [Acidobacteria bacterium]|nr:hypothetical protein [Acidobacteriota bacterium]